MQGWGAFLYGLQNDKTGPRISCEQKGWGLAPALFGPDGYRYRSDIRNRPARVARGIKPPQSMSRKLKVLFIEFSFILWLTFAFQEIIRKRRRIGYEAAKYFLGKISKFKTRFSGYLHLEMSGFGLDRFLSMP